MRLKSRIQKIEDKKSITKQLGIAELILAARNEIAAGNTPKKSTKEMLDKQAQSPGLAGRIAKARLRVGWYTR